MGSREGLDMVEFGMGKFAKFSDGLVFGLRGMGWNIRLDRHILYIECMIIDDPFEF